MPPPPHTSGARAWIAVATIAAIGLPIAGALWVRSGLGEITPERPAPIAAPTSAPTTAPTVAPTGIGRPGDLPAPTEAPPSTAAPSTPPADDPEPATLEEQRRRLFARMREGLALSAEQLAAVEAIFAASPVLGQGNPAISEHPMTRAECRARRAEAKLPLITNEPACGAPNMAPLFDPARGQAAKDARVCMDHYEFPDLACEYPVVNVRAREAALLCRAVGKRICDAHEWEGACAGALHDADAVYEWGRPRKEASWYHNHKRAKVWAYGPAKNHAICPTGSTRSASCPGGGWEKCGSNTYPAGAFPLCRSTFGVFDQHGNVAEHMSLPVVPEDLAKNGDKGFTEMKGSWFVFGSIEAHEDDCHFRAPAWHETRVMSENSHLNYHLGFRCCKDVEGAP